MVNNLFDGRDEEIRVANLSEQTPKEKKQKWNYRKAENKINSCRNCVNVRMKNLNNKTYYKCILIRDNGGETTDIRLSYVCDKLQENDNG